MVETWVAENDEKSHEMAVEVLDWIRKASEHESATPETKELLQKTVDAGMPPMGESIAQLVPQVLGSQIQHMTELMRKEVATLGEDNSDGEHSAH